MIGLSRMPTARRAALEAAAVAEFSAAGFRGASLNAIIQSVGMSKSSFYHVIDSKADLFEQVVASLAERVAERLRPPDPDSFAGPTFWDGIDDFVARFAELAATDADLAGLGRMFYLSDAPDAVDPSSDAAGARPALLADVRDWVDTVLAVGRRGGDITGTLPLDLQRHLVFAVVRAMDEWSVAHLAELGPQAVRQLATAQSEALRGLLEPRRRETPD